MQVLVTILTTNVKRVDAPCSIPQRTEDVYHVRRPATNVFPSLMITRTCQDPSLTHRQQPMLMLAIEDVVF